MFNNSVKSKMFTTKNAVDKHVKSSLSKLNENEVSSLTKLEWKFYCMSPAMIMIFGFPHEFQSLLFCIDCTLIYEILYESKCLLGGKGTIVT